MAQKILGFPNTRTGVQDYLASATDAYFPDGTEFIADRAVEGCWLVINHAMRLALLVYVGKHGFAPDHEEVDYRAALKYSSRRR